jgi:hypothetical protein
MNIKFVRTPDGEPEPGQITLVGGIAKRGNIKKISVYYKSKRSPEEFLVAWGLIAINKYGYWELNGWSRRTLERQFLKKGMELNYFMPSVRSILLSHAKKITELAKEK